MQDVYQYLIWGLGIRVAIVLGMLTDTHYAQIVNATRGMEGSIQFAVFTEEGDSLLHVGMSLSEATAVASEARADGVAAYVVQV